MIIMIRDFNEKEKLLYILLTPSESDYILSNYSLIMIPHSAYISLHLVIAKTVFKQPKPIMVFNNFVVTICLYLSVPQHFN